MTLREFVKDVYHIENRLRLMKLDPVKQVMERDDLPYDEIKMVDGVLQKVIMLDDTEFIPILDLLTLTKEDVESIKDEEFKAAYNGFMDNVDVTVIDVQNIINSINELDSMQDKKNKLLERLS